MFGIIAWASRYRDRLRHLRMHIIPMIPFSSAIYEPGRFQFSNEISDFRRHKDFLKPRFSALDTQRIALRSLAIKA